ncbi:50S ribosomal protein L21e [Candidatus Woesearchaeota archaeon]|nr:50S ribosomal protein L21e [Candidatus Woesearchaeota archaeon]
MVKRIGGMRRKTRYKFRKEVRSRGKVSITRYFQSFNSGDRVYLGLESSVHKGMYHPRFIGKSGTVKGMRGKCYEVAINDLGKEKVLIIHPVHLRKIEGG